MSVNDVVLQEIAVANHQNSGAVSVRSNGIEKDKVSESTMMCVLATF